jgi:hypothetical protein
MSNIADIMLMITLELALKESKSKVVEMSMRLIKNTKERKVLVEWYPFRNINKIYFC